MRHVAIDIGANGGTVYLGDVTSDRFEVREVTRFDNRPVAEDGRYVWDVPRLRTEVEDGLRATAAVTDAVDSLAIDTWGLDFGLLRDGELLRNPTSYRDPSATTTRDAVLESVGRRDLFASTGVTNWNTPNTLFQYHSLAADRPELLAEADRLVMMPQLLSTLLGADPAGEVTVASTTQMLDPRTREWATDLLDGVGVSTDLLPPLREPGTVAGTLDGDYGGAVESGTPILHTASHDTASAVAGLPLSGDRAFLSTGTWFVLGFERGAPVTSDAAADAGLSNELGVDDTVRLLRNVNGFFLLEECREAWRAAGETTDYDDLIAGARAAPSRASLVDPDDDAFGIEGEMPAQIRAACHDRGQRVPEDEGEVVRCILDSLAAKTAVAFEDLASVADSDPDVLHVGGGGVRNDLFCQLLADATGRTVRAGPVEATAVGNLLVQAVAAGDLPDVEAGRRLVRSALPSRDYRPSGASWADAKASMRRLAADS